MPERVLGIEFPRLGWNGAVVSALDDQLITRAAMPATAANCPIWALESDMVLQIMRVLSFFICVSAMMESIVTSLDG